MIKKSAFTLAEVLITLTIIGIIAAITIPNLMQSWRKHQVEVGIKEAYSILSNTLNFAKAETGSLDEMVISALAQTDSVKYFAEEYIKPYIKYSEYCPPMSTEATCNAFYYKEKARPRRLYSLHNILQDNGIGAYQYWARFSLNNGMYLGIGRSWSSSPYIGFIIDIKGA